MDRPFPNDIVVWLRDAADGQLARYVTGYFSGYSGRLFEKLIEASDPDEFTPWDAIAVTALSVDLPVEAASLLLLPSVVRTQANDLLRQVPAGVDLEAPEAAALIAEGSHAQQLYALLRGLPGMGATKTSKLLAAKRPSLVPIRDSVVSNLLGADDAWWKPMRQLATDSTVRTLVANVSTMAPTGVSALRILDVILWRFGKDLEELAGSPT